MQLNILYLDYFILFIREDGSMENLVLRVMSSVLGYDFDKDDFDLSDAFWSLGFTDDLFEEFVYQLEEELGVEDVDSIISIKMSVAKAIDKLDAQYS